jgi:hypothetical protein
LTQGWCWGGENQPQKHPKQIIKRTSFCSLPEYSDLIESD